MTDHDDFERNFWGDCTNTFDEEQKHFVYAEYMGLEREHYTIKAPGVSILDVGGGPASMLLKAKGFATAWVLDPLADDYPAWVAARYASKGILLVVGQGEELIDWNSEIHGEIWLYNVLQHTDDPGKVLDGIWARLAPGGTFRFFEWINIPPHEGHPHEIKVETFDKLVALAADGLTESPVLSSDGCYGAAFAGWLKKAPDKAENSSDNP